MSPSNQPDHGHGELPEPLSTVLPPDPAVRAEYARVLGVLRASGGTCRVTELPHRLLHDDADQGVGDLTDQYQSVYLSVHRELLPVLEAVGIVTYDDHDGTISLTTR